MKLIIALIFALPGYAFAENSEVIFFGGYGSSAAQMKCWEEGANKTSFANDYTFKGIEYPAGATPKAASAVAAGKSKIQNVVDEINSHPNRHYVIVGHSSGAAISNQVARLVKNGAQIELVNLDGFAPDQNLQKKVSKSTCWYARNQATGSTSPNAASMTGNCKNSKAYSNSTCKSSWCMHFSLVNTAPPPTLGSPEYKVRGYEGCRTNLAFLETGHSSAASSKPANPGAK